MDKVDCIRKEQEVCEISAKGHAYVLQILCVYVFQSFYFTSQALCRVLQGRAEIPSP